MSQLADLWSEPDAPHDLVRLAERGDETALAQLASLGWYDRLRDLSDHQLVEMYAPLPELSGLLAWALSHKELTVCERHTLHDAAWRHLRRTT